MRNLLAQLVIVEIVLRVLVYGALQGATNWLARHDKEFRDYVDRCDYLRRQHDSPADFARTRLEYALTYKKMIARYESGDYEALDHLDDLEWRVAA